MSTGKLPEVGTTRDWAPWGDDTAEPLSPEVLELVRRYVRHPTAALRRTLERYRQRWALVRRLSSSERAGVYVAVDRVLAREVVIKVHRGEPDRVTACARNEAAAMIAVQHPNVAVVHDVGQYDDWPYAVMERCECDLRAWARSTPQPQWPEILARILEAGAGLQHVHAIGWAHGDIKPANILIKNGVAKLADFGHATRLGEERGPSGGTLGFTAPDVADLGPSVEGDVFSLAATAWFCLFGQLPHGDYSDSLDGATAWVQGYLRARQFEIQRPVELPTGMPRSLVDVLASGLLPRPEQRPTLDALLDRLRARLPDPPPRLVWREQVLIASAASVLAVTFVLGSIAAATRLGPIEGPPMVWKIVAIERPLARAEMAAKAGDGETAIAELNRVYSRVRGMSAGELEILIGEAEEIATILGSTSPDHLALARAIVAELRVQRGS